MRLRTTILLLIVGFVIGAKECDHRDFGKDGTVCVCSESYCDTVEPIERQPPGTFLIYTSSKAGDRLTQRQGRFNRVKAPSGADTVIVNRKAKFQAIKGFGGAFTDATGINYNALGPQAKKHFIRSYFGKDGIEYNMGRVPIGGTDFSTHGYSYLDSESDDKKKKTNQKSYKVLLTNYTLAKEDFQYKIPLIREAEKVAGRRLDLLASAWVAPKWMKSNGEYAGWTFLKEEYFQDRMDYEVRFLDLYREQGVEFWGITTGNEPSLVLAPFNKIPTVGFQPSHQMKWIKNNLGPTIRKSKYSHLKILALDDQRFLLPLIEEQLKDNLTNSYIDGIGIHWYWNWLIPASSVANLHKKFPDKFILGTEACRVRVLGQIFFEEAVSLGSWSRGEDYANDIIQNLQNWMGGWIDWNMALDPTGGPTYIDNNVDSPIIVNTATGEFYKQPMFYAMGHFSKFLPKGSTRIQLSQQKINDVLLVAFERPDRSTAAIIQNKGDNEMDLNLFDEERGEINLKVSPKSINSLVYW